ncbi:polyprenyl synthetase family protein [Salinispira pacifica]
MNTLRYIIQPVSAELEQVERNLSVQISRIADGHAVTNTYSRLADRVVGHLFKTHGKRLRPLLFLLSARSAGVGSLKGTDALIQVGTSVELIHSASLIHDDVIDEATFRRDRVSVNERYGNKIAVLAGDILYTQFYSLVSTLADLPAEVRLRLLELFTTVTRRMCFGEIYEERMRRQRKPPEFEDYLDTIDNKTASLMAVCCEAGGVVAGAPEETVETLRLYGYHLGMAYQLLDDLDDGDAVYPDNSRIGESAARHVRSAMETAAELPENEATTRLRAIVDAVGGARIPLAASQTA